jgi:hypothetical protein
MHGVLYYCKVLPVEGTYSSGDALKYLKAAGIPRVPLNVHRALHSMTLHRAILRTVL